MDAIFARHERIAFQLSGGKDSLACLHLLRPHWAVMTVYWLDTGDTMPEVRAVIDDLAARLPRFVRLASSSRDTIAQFGLPSDIVPTSATPMGLYAMGQGTALQDRYSCCFRTVMAPMHQRMLDDGVTLIVRGQKNADANKSTLRSGDVEHGIEFLFPVQDWTDEQVLTYLKDQGVAYPSLYDHGLRSAPDCMACSAWWEDGRGTYLRQHHPIAFKEYQARLNTISDIVAPHIAAFNQEVSHD